MTHYINAHDHLFHYQDQARALADIKEHQIKTAFVTENEAEFWSLHTICQDQPLLKAGYGLHPWQVRSTSSHHLSAKALEACDFIGEIGLDTVWAPEEAYFSDQQRIFQAFLKAAHAYGKLASIHTKGAEKEVLAALEKYPQEGHMIHWYSGPLDLVPKYLALGCYFTLSVDLPLKKHAQELARLLPLDRILTETDGPTALAWLTGEDSWPHDVIFLVKKLAQIKNLTRGQMQGIIAANYARLFP